MISPLTCLLSFGLSCSPLAAIAAHLQDATDAAEISTVEVASQAERESDAASSAAVAPDAVAATVGVDVVPLQRPVLGRVPDDLVHDVREHVVDAVAVDVCKDGGLHVAGLVDDDHLPRPARVARVPAPEDPAVVPAARDEIDPATDAYKVVETYEDMYAQDNDFFGLD